VDGAGDGGRRAGGGLVGAVAVAGVGISGHRGRLVSVEAPDPVELLRRLIRFDTTNPPGAEAAAVAHVEEILRGAGLQTRLLESVPGRPNLVARLPGRGVAPPLLLQAHVDVVPADPAGWTHPPFEATLADGYVWGRGALDMKSGLAMMVTALVRAVAAGATPPGDVVLAVLADEEGGGTHGARFLVDRHPELFAGVRYALGEFGGFTLDLAGRRFAPIQVSEKQICQVVATVRGPGGHGSLAVGGDVPTRLAGLLSRLDRPRLPVHLTPVVATMLDAIEAETGGAASRVVGLLRNPRLTDPLIRAAGETGRTLMPLFRHTATPNIVRAGESWNVRPTSATVQIDGRVLPGYGPEDLLGELRRLLGDDVELEVVRFDPVPAGVDYGLFDVLSAALRDQAPDLRPIPLLMPASTDGRNFSRLGIQSYGFTPMTLPKRMAFARLIHAADERIPVAAVEFGTRCIGHVLERFDQAKS
jgi:acetylornithine deacetylase/succinyl-diaminopimelate desuccinylase-like protein